MGMDVLGNHARPRCIDLQGVPLKRSRGLGEVSDSACSTGEGGVLGTVQRPQGSAPSTSLGQEDAEG